MREKFVAVAVVVLLITGLTIGLYRMNNTDDDNSNYDYDDLNLDEGKYNPEQHSLEKVIEGNNEFSFDLYHQLNKDENVFYSPWSISSAFAMTYEGARGKTAEEIGNVFGFPGNRSELRKSYGFMHDRYNRDRDSYNISTANSAWIQDDFNVLEEYKFVLMNYYFSNVTNVDFINEPSKACKMINDWVYNNTNGKIEDILRESDINDYTRLVLGNAIYFDGKWAEPFNENDTRDSTFTTADGKEVTVPFMRQDGKFNYTSTDDLKILQKKYSGYDMSMLFILPKNDELGSLSSSLDYDDLKNWRDDLKKTSMKMVSIPKFNMSTDYDLKEILYDMGMPTPFRDDADFSGIDGTQSLFIQFVKHKAFVDVNEKGTEAAASTFVGIGRTAVDERPIFKADHPFMFIIQDDRTGNILFMGQVNDPTA